MSHLRNVATTGIVALALGATVAATGGSAVADPNPAGFRTYAAVGSDTTQAVWNGLVNGSAPVVKGIASYDATPIGSTIQTSAGGPTYLRPTGSGNGVKALSAAWDPTNHVWSGTTLSNADIAFSRSSSRPSLAGNDLAYIPFARDAVSVAIDPAGSKTPTSFTTAQLAAIYGGADDNVAGTGVTYAADGNPVVGTVELKPLLPQSGSGTRSFFLAAIGNPTLAGYVDANSTIVENDGTALTSPGQLIPFSAAQWIAQGNGVQTNTTSGLKLTSINKLAPYKANKKTGVLTPGPLFGTVTNGAYSTAPVPGTGVFNRDTYNVVPTVYFGGTASQTALLAVLTGTATGDLGNKKAVAVIKKFGFGPLSYIGDQSQYLTGAFSH